MPGPELSNKAANFTGENEKLTKKQNDVENDIKQTEDEYTVSTSKSLSKINHLNDAIREYEESLEESMKFS